MPRRVKRRRWISRVSLRQLKWEAYQATLQAQAAAAGVQQAAAKGEEVAEEVIDGVHLVVRNTEYPKPMLTVEFSAGPPFVKLGGTAWEFVSGQRETFPLELDVELLEVEEREE